MEVRRPVLPLLLPFLLTLSFVVTGTFGYGRISAKQNGRIFNDVYFTYEGKKASRESDLPLCVSDTSVCSLVHLRFWLPVLSQRLCRCPRDQCPYQWETTTSDKSIQLNSRIQMKFCKPVAAFPTCTAGAPSAVFSRHTEASALDLEDQHDVQINCTCLYPAVHVPLSYNTRRGRRNTEITTYTCKQLEPCGNGESCGAIRMDTYSTYYTCKCPANQMCLFKEEYRKKVKRDVDHLFYKSRAYVGQCRALRR